MKKNEKECGGGDIESVAYLGFHFGGGGKYFFGKVWVFAWRSHAFARGVRACSPGNLWCNLVRFGEYFSKILEKNWKNIHFYIKIIDNVLLCTLYLGVLEHTPQIYCQLCNLVCFVAHFP